MSSVAGEHVWTFAYSGVCGVWRFGMGFDLASHNGPMLDALMILDRRPILLLCGAFGIVGFFVAIVPPTQGFAQSRFVQQEQPRLEPTKPLSLSPQMMDRRALNSTAFFINDLGYLLTARHAVENCIRVVISKEKHWYSGRVVAISAKYDLAILKVSKTLGIPAVFSRSNAASTNDMVFAGSYDALAGLQMGGGVLANARVITSFIESEDGHLIIDSPVTFGASGAPVLDKNGLVQGVVSRRTTVNRGLRWALHQSKRFCSAAAYRLNRMIDHNCPALRRGRIAPPPFPRMSHAGKTNDDGCRFVQCPFSAIG